MCPHGKAAGYGVKGRKLVTKTVCIVEFLLLKKNKAHTKHPLIHKHGQKKKPGAMYHLLTGILRMILEETFNFL